MTPFEPDNNQKTHTNFPLSAGTAVSRYRIVKQIGSGGMGDVYLAEDTDLSRKVALKFLSGEYAREPESTVRFKREAQAVAALNHPNVVTIHEVAEYQHRPFIAMEFVEGTSLRDLIRDKKLELSRVIEIAIQMCEGLNEAHRAGIVHRDIKPGNVLVGKDGRVKIADFGLAKVKGASEITRPGTALGTIGYASPEQEVDGEADQRGDIFSFGVVLYEMLTGQSPFRKDTMAATRQAIVSVTPEPLARLNPKVPERLQYIVEKALEKDQEIRYQHIDDLLADLKRVKRDMEPIPSQPSRKLAFWLGGVLGVVILGLLLWSNPSIRRGVRNWIDPIPPQKHLVVLPFANIGKDAANQAFCDGMIETVTSKLSQLEQFLGSLWIVPASEVRERGVTSAREARRAFGVTLAITGSVQRLSDKVRITLNLVDAKTERQLRSEVIDASLANICALQDSSVIKLVGMLEVELQPEQQRVLTAGGTTIGGAYDLYLQGRGYLQRYEKLENIDTAIGLFQQALGEDPQYALAHAGLGEAYWRKYEAVKDPQWVEHAIENSQRAAEINDQLAPVHITMGLVYNGTGRYEEAVQEFQRALTLDSVSHEAILGMAKAYVALNEIEQAEAIFLRVIEKKPDYWRDYDSWLCYFDLAFFYLRQGRNEDAAKPLQKVVTLLPDNVLAYDNLGALYFYLERWTDASKMWERALQIGPTYVTYSNLGTLYFMEKRYSDAARMFEKALDIKDHDYRVWGNLASAYYWMTGERDKGLDTYQRATEMAEEQRAVNPQDLGVVSDLAEYYAILGKRIMALPLVEQALTAEPDNIEIMVTAGLVYEELGERDMALQWIAKGLENGYPISLIETLPELQQLLADPRFEDLRHVGSGMPRKSSEVEK